jgi:thiamine-monophosphate kinase
MHRGNTEFSLIHSWFSDQLALVAPERGVVLGIGDDAAILCGERLGPVVSLTSSIVTLPPHPSDSEAPSADEAYGRAFIETAFSRLPTMEHTRATSLVATLSITAEESDLSRCTSIINGVRNACANLGICIVGGDTTSGPLTVTIFLRRLELTS